jgi:hypothetical protein
MRWRNRGGTDRGGACETAWVVRSGRQAVGWVQAERGVSSARASLSSETLRDPLPGARPCAERVGFAVRAWTTGAEIVGTREPVVGGYAPGPPSVSSAWRIIESRSSFHSIVGPDSRKAAAMLAIPMA